MEGTVVFYPAIGISHLVPMMELAKLLLGHDLSATVVIQSAAMMGAVNLDAFASRVTSAHPAISFHTLPRVSLTDEPPTTPFSRLHEILCLSNPLLLDFLRTVAETTTVRAVILDFFCTEALDVAAELRLPSYLLFSSSASNLAAFLYLPTIHNQSTTNFGELGDNPIHFPGIPPMPASSMPMQLQDRDGESYKRALFHLDRLPKSDGIIANTFRSLEEGALTAISDGLCLPGRPAPPVYCIGPLTAGDDGGEQQKHECLSWLDSQPKQSVVFLCFGSKGTFSAEQLIDIATGLERSGQRFLWVVRDPTKPETDLDALLPDGFLERTAERGLVVKSWAPQVAVLSHESVGGFVTHCGWNSVLEAIRTGVPMIAWPLYAEQRMNKVHLVEEMKLAAELKGGNKGMVSAEEVEGRVRWLMESEGGRELRERALAAKESAMAALKEGGSSHAELMEFVVAVKHGAGGLDE